MAADRKQSGRYNICGMERGSGSFIKITVLIWADILALYALWVMITYLTNVWKMNFVPAATIVNVSQGVATIMPIGMSYLVETCISNYRMLLLSSAAYSIGLGFLAMSTPPVLSKATGMCSAYEPACIGNVQKILFYMSLPLIAVGISGHLVSLQPFLEEQNGEAERKNAFPIVGPLTVILVPVISAIALPYINPWSVRFGIPAICTLVATLLFISGSWSYNREKQPTGSPLTRVFRVFVASSLKIHLPCPKDATELYENEDSGNQLQRHTSGLRCLDKAAIISPSQPPEEQERNRWKLCKVTEVEETKIVIRMIPMWMTFITLGIIMSIGNTYFLEQANHMNRKVGRLKVPLPILLMFYEIAKSQAKRCSKSKLICTPQFGIAFGMLISILCCITAAKVEDRRISVINKHGLLDKPNDTIPMTMFWLLPQYLLLGIVDGLARGSVERFFQDQLPDSMINYMTNFNEGVFGAGIIGGVLSVYIVGKVSEQGGGRSSWFEETLNKSRLDNYYWTLAVLSSINLLFFALVACWYPYKEARVNKEEPPQGQETSTKYQL